MENNKYLDKVIEHLVRGTRLDYGFKTRIFSTPFNHNVYPSIYLNPLRNYCKNQFGLTEEEIEYVWVKYSRIILDKIANGK